MEENTPQISQGASNDTKTIVTVLLLIFAFPIGFIVMWLWPKWPVWIKLLISLPIFLSIIGVVLAITLVTANPAGKLQELQQMYPTPTIVSKSVSPTAINFTFDIPSLVGKDLNEVIAILGAPKGGDPTAQQLKLGVTEWDKTFIKDEKELLVTYNIADKKIVDFFVGTDDPTGKTKDKKQLLEVTNTTENDPRYTIEFVKTIKDPSSFTGIKIIPK